jgi:hypothetical protein
VRRGARRCAALFRGETPECGTEKRRIASQACTFLLTCSEVKPNSDGVQFDLVEFRDFKMVDHILTTPVGK